MSSKQLAVTAKALIKVLEKRGFFFPDKVEAMPYIETMKERK